MSYAGGNLRYITNCNHCSELRPLTTHLHELALVCEYLDNSVPYSDGNSQRNVTTTTISDWLKLASQLEAVKVDAWRFESDFFYCGEAADRVTSDSTHFSLYSTALTRFIFVASALEETYRFVDRYYKPFADDQQIPEKSRSRSSSIKAAALIDAISQDLWPKHLIHLTQNYRLFFGQYRKNHKSELGGMQFADEKKPAYALHLVRNLRNHIAHGVFPLIPNPDYSWGADRDCNDLLQLLNHSCRISALYIQMLMQRFNLGFASQEYQSFADAYGPEYERFLTHCNVGYIGILHLNGEFSLADALDWTSDP